MLLSLKKNGLSSLFKEVRVFKVKVEAPKPRKNQSRRKIGQKEVFWKFGKYVKNRSKVGQK